MTVRLPKSWDAVLLAALCALVFLSCLGCAPLWDDDETRFASVAREMLQSGDLAVPRYNGGLADKPPLLFWAIAGSFAALGQNAMAARIPSGLASIVALLTVWQFAARLYSRDVARWSAISLGTSLLFFAEAGLATTDAIFLACTTLTLAVGAGAWWREGISVRDESGTLPRLSRGRALFLGALGGLGTLCKGPAGFILPAVTLWVFAWWGIASCASIRGRSRLLRSGVSALGCLRPFWLTLGFLAIAFPWHAAVWSQVGGEWFRVFYGVHHLGRLGWVWPSSGVAMTAPEGQGGFPLFQVAALLAGLFPWSVFLPLAAWRTIRGASGKGDAPSCRASEVLLSFWLFVWLAAASLSITQLPHYALPGFPAACIMIGVLVVRSFQYPGGLRDGWLYAAAGGLVLGGVAISAAGVVGARCLAWPALSAAGWLGIIPVLAALAFVCEVRNARRNRAAWVFALGAVILQCAAFLFVAPGLGASNPVPGIVRKAVDTSDGNVRVAVYRCSLPGVVWASGGHVHPLASASDLVGFLRSGPDARAFIAEPAIEELVVLLGSCPEPIARCRPLGRRDDMLLLGPLD